MPRRVASERPAQSTVSTGPVRRSARTAIVGILRETEMPPPTRRSARVAARSGFETEPLMRPNSQERHIIRNLNRPLEDPNVRTTRSRRRAITAQIERANAVATARQLTEEMQRDPTRFVGFHPTLEEHEAYTLRSFAFNFRHIHESLDDPVDLIVTRDTDDRGVPRSRRSNPRHNMLHFEDTFVPPRVIDPNEISEDESDEEINRIVELPPVEPEPVMLPPPPAVESRFPDRAVTRSMSRNPEFYNQPGSSRRTIPYPSRMPKPVLATKSLKIKTENDVPGTKTVIKVDKMSPCTICCEEAPKRPVACTYCRQTIGCRYCVKKWFFTTNMSHLDQRTPYPIGTTDRNHKRCPLCRADWGDTMRIVSAVERDAYSSLIQATNPPTAATEDSTTKA